MSNQLHDAIRLLLILPAASCTSSPPAASVATSTTLAIGQDATTKLVVDAGSIYWSGPVPYELATDGTPPLWTRGSQVVSGFAVGGGNLWVVESANHRIARLDDTNREQILTPLTSTVTAIASQDAQVAWATADGAIQIRNAALDAPVATLAIEPGGAYQLAIDNTAVYWTVIGTQAAGFQDGAVRSVPLSGGPVTTLASGQTFPASLAVDRDAVYWVSFAGGPSSAVMRAAKTGGAPSPLATLSVGQDPSGIAVDDAFVYVADEHEALNTDEAEGTIVKLPKAGGDPIVLASGQQRPISIAIDDDSVYWTTEGDGAIRRAPK
jgi:sugar lactone lactonase YvrE